MERVRDSRNRVRPGSSRLGLLAPLAQHLRTPPFLSQDRSKQYELAPGVFAQTVATVRHAHLSISGRRLPTRVAGRRSSPIPSPWSATGTTYLSGDFIATVAGTYRWVATHSGDANNAADATTCNDPAESVEVTAAVGSVRVVKTASPLTLPAPGGTFTCTVVVTNTGAQGRLCRPDSEDLPGGRGRPDCHDGQRPGHSPTGVSVICASSARRCYWPVRLSGGGPPHRRGLRQHPPAADNVTVTEVARPAFVFKGCLADPAPDQLRCGRPHRQGAHRPWRIEHQGHADDHEQNAMRPPWF